MMARRYYSDNDRAAALAVLAANDGNLSRTARETKVPRATLQLWAAEPDRAAPSALRDVAARMVFEAMGRDQAPPAARLRNKPAGLCGRIGPGYVPARACVYLVLCDGFAKIGISANLSARLAAMRTSCPHKITLDSVAEMDSRGEAANLEDALHDRFWHAHHHGEWFRLSAAEIDDVRAELARHGESKRATG